MNRRSYVALVGTVGVGGLAGCLDGALSSPDGGGSDPTATDTEPSDPGPSPTDAGDPALPVPSEEIHTVLRKDAIPAITEPAFGPDWDGLEPELSAGDRVIGVARDGGARAYPLSAVQSAGGVVNDEVGDLPVVLAVDPADNLVAYGRRVDGTELSFESADERHLAADGSRWLRVIGEAVDGPHEGTTLERTNTRSQMFWFA